MNNQSVKFIKSLQLKKYRKLHSCFFVEGKVNVIEAIQSNVKVKQLFLTKSAISELAGTSILDSIEYEICTEKDLLKAGTFKSNSFGLAIVDIVNNLHTNLGEGEWCIALDNISDPGNLGTIVRTADWFGIKKVFCSLESVDFYNPKVVNSTKGSFSRVEVIYCDLKSIVGTYKTLSAEMSGESIYDVKWPKEGGVVLLGNESHGVSKELSELAHEKITIPRVGNAESLNVAIAGAIICSQIVQ